jgi:hypothetical protein
MIKRPQIRAREQGICARCGRAGCDAHHRLFKSRGGLDTWDNQIYVCRACHDWAHGNETEAQAAGLVVPSGVDPATVAVVYHLFGAKVLLGGDGSVNIAEAA